MARPTKWSPELQELICTEVKQGVRPEAAAGKHGIGRQTFYDWMAGRVDDAVGFRTAVERARDDWEAAATQTVLAGDDVGVGFGPAKAALEVLSRRMPRQWAQQVKHHVETLEDEFLSTLEAVCRDADVFARVRQETDCRFVFIAFCEALSRRESESETAGDAGREPAPIH